MPVRQPKLRILCNGTVVQSALSAVVMKNAYFQADTFSARFAFNADPRFGLAYWSDEQPPIVLDIQASLDGTWVSLVLGQVDHVQPCVAQGVIEVEGRDFVTASLIDTITSRSYLNQTASGIVQQIASGHGYTADVEPTHELVGTYDGMDRNITGMVNGSRTTREWDLLCTLAQQEGYDAWTSGRTLHFRPPPNGQPFTVVYDQASPTSNVLTLTVEKAMSFARDIAVIVRSWNSQIGNAVHARAGASKATVNAGEARVYTFVRPNLTLDAAQSLANSIHQNMSRHEKTVTFARPGDFTLEPRQLISLQMNSPFDGAYRIDRVEHRLSFTEGWMTTVKAKTEPAVE